MADTEIGLIISVTIQSKLQRSSSTNSCIPCIYGIGHRVPIPMKSESLTTRLLEVIHSDLNGPLEVP